MRPRCPGAPDRGAHTGCAFLAHRVPACWPCPAGRPGRGRPRRSHTPPAATTAAGTASTARPRPDLLGNGTPRQRAVPELSAPAATVIGLCLSPISRGEGGRRCHMWCIGRCVAPTRHASVVSSLQTAQSPGWSGVDRPGLRGSSWPREPRGYRSLSLAYPAPRSSGEPGGCRRGGHHGSRGADDEGRSRAGQGDPHRQDHDQARLTGRSQSTEELTLGS